MGSFFRRVRAALVSWWSRLFGRNNMPPTATVPPGAPLPPIASSRLGVCAHVLPGPALDWLVRAQIEHVRITCYWDGVNRIASMRDEFFTQVNELAQIGVRPLVVFHQSPVSDPDGGGLGAFVAGVLLNTSGKIGAVQLYNEMNVGDAAPFTPKLPGRTERERGRVYGDRLKAYYPVIKAAQPDVKIVLGGIAGNPTDFLLGVCDRAPVFFDAVAVHCYGDPVEQLITATQQARDVLNVCGVPRTVPIYATEVGSERGRAAFSDGDHAQVVDVLNCLTAMRDGRAAGVDRLYWYCEWNDASRSRDGLTDRDGLLNDDWTERPAAVYWRTVPRVFPWRATDVARAIASSIEP